MVGTVHRCEIPERQAAGSPASQMALARLRRSILVLSSSGLTDRSLIHSDVLRYLEKNSLPVVWATSAANPHCQDLWTTAGCSVAAFPGLFPFREFPVNHLRRLNDFAWDYTLRDPSRLSMMRHIRNQTQRWYIRALKGPAWLLARLRLTSALELLIEDLMITTERSPEATQRLQALERQSMSSI